MSPDAGLKANVSFFTSLHATGRRSASGGAVTGTGWEISAGMAVPKMDFGPEIAKDTSQFRSHAVFQIESLLAHVVQKSKPCPTGCNAANRVLVATVDSGGNGMTKTRSYSSMPAMMTPNRNRPRLAAVFPHVGIPARAGPMSVFSF